MTANPTTESEDRDRPFDYDAFISYRTQISPDKQIAQELQRVLETYPVPKEFCGSIVSPTRWRNRLKVFRDRTDLSASSDLSESIRAKLERSRFLIVICSPSARESEYCAQEIRQFREYHGDGRILPLLVQGEPEEAFPEALHSRSPPTSSGAGSPGIDAAGAEPLAADVCADDLTGNLKKLRGWRLPKSEQARFKILPPMLGMQIAGRADPTRQGAATPAAHEDCLCHLGVDGGGDALHSRATET